MRLPRFITVDTAPFQAALGAVSLAYDPATHSIVQGGDVSDGVGDVTSDKISDATGTGRALLTSSDAEAGRNAIEAASADDFESLQAAIDAIDDSGLPTLDVTNEGASSFLRNVLANLWTAIQGKAARLLGGLTTAEQATARGNIGAAAGDDGRFTNLNAPFSANRLDLNKIANLPGSAGAKIELRPDPANPAVDAIFISSNTGSRRIYFGDPAQKDYTANFGGVTGIESMPSLNMGPNLIFWGGVNMSIQRNNGMVYNGRYEPYHRFLTENYGDGVVYYPLTIALNKVGFAGVTAPHSHLHGNGSVALGSHIVSTDAVTLSEQHHSIGFDTTNASISQSLPAASTCPGRRYSIWKTVASNTLTVTNLAGGDVVLTAQFACVVLVSEGTFWRVESKN